MKLRTIAFLMGILMLFASLVSCDTTDVAVSSNVTSEVVETSSQPEESKPEKETSSAKTEATSSARTEATSSEEEKNYVFEIIYPTVTASNLKINLTTADVQRFKAKVTETKNIAKSHQGARLDEFRNAVYELLTLEEAFQTECDAAYLLYCCDMNDDTWDTYMDAYNRYNDVHDSFWGFRNSLYGTSIIFVDALEQIIDETFGKLTAVRSDAYFAEMKKLEGEYNSLKNNNASDDEMFEVYKKYLIAADNYAKSGDSTDYYDYACEVVYNRTDTAEQREVFREYVKEYLVPLGKLLGMRYRVFDSQLSADEYDLSNSYLYDAYDTFEENYLFDYFLSLPKSASEIMVGVFDEDKIIIGDKDTSYNSAMVYTVGSTPICYFHKGKMAIDTMAHELGHYYADTVSNTKDFSFSLKETHSTANTLLCYSYLSEKIDNIAFHSTETYMTFDWMYQIVASVIKDEFDEIIATSDLSTLTLQELQNIMNDLINEYDVRDFSTNMVTNLMNYWRKHAISYFGENYCYAEGFLASCQIYIKSKTDYDAAIKIYKKLVEEPKNGGEYIATIKHAGLTTPYDEQTFIEIGKLFEIQ